jgi:hypothetical protein
VKKWEPFFKTDSRGKKIFVCTVGKNKDWGNEYNVAQRVCGIAMFNNDYFHEGSHQIAAKTRPLIIDDAVMTQVMFNLFICAAEELDILFEVVSNAKKTDSIDDYEKSALKDEMGGE